ncbi:MAG: hypothetical protein V7637_4555 [Mycobacteriales bacterium]
MLLAVSVLVALVVRGSGGPGVAAAAGHPEPGSVDPARRPAATGDVAMRTPAATPAAPAPAAPPIAPPGYQVHHEAAGYWVAIPAGWATDTERTGEREWWGDLARPDVKLLFVTIKAAAAKRQTAKAALLGYENTERHGRGMIFYHRVRLVDQPRLPGATSVAELEFTDRDYAEGAQTWHYHTVVRAVVAGNKLYTAEFMILHDIYQDSGDTESDWARAVPTVQKILASLRLG